MSEHEPKWTDHGPPTMKLEDVPGLGRWRSSWASHVAHYDSMVEGLEKAATEVWGPPDEEPES